MMDSQAAISFLPVIPLRAIPSHSSEMVSQILFGEIFHILEREEEWLFIETDADEYRGWIDIKQALEISETYYHNLKKQTSLVTKNMQSIFNEENDTLHLPAGCNLPFYTNGEFALGKHTYKVKEENIIFLGSADFAKSSVEIAQSFLNAPYLWGGRTHFGIDCSGFSQIVFKILGIAIKRDASQQAKQGKTVDFLSEAQTGDLAFFDNEDGKITHVGMMLGNDKIIHASGRVKIDAIDNQGIYSSDLKKYSHKLRIIKRYI